MKSFKVTLVNKAKNLNETIEAPCDKPILDVAEENGLKLPSLCRAGACAVCVGKLLKEKLNQSEQSFLDEEQIEEGYALLCVAYPTSDCTIATEMEHELF